MKITRREYLLGSAAALGLLAVNQFYGGVSKVLLGEATDAIGGKVFGASAKYGHKLWSDAFSEPSGVIEKDIVIIGGGVSGLAAAYRLKKEGVDDFLLLELEDHVGGNSQFGKNEVTAFPWGAHYVPLLSEETRAVRTLFEELGVIEGYDQQSLPIYNELYICAEPQERLFIHGRWQDGIVPNSGLSDFDHQEYQRFFLYMDSLKNKVGRDGKRLFSIPLDTSSQDQEWIKLDQITMAQWMEQEGYQSDFLKWYVNYCCRDDFGTDYSQTSAWAGHHYFAARNGVASNTKSGAVLTWSEGNGWITQKLEAACSNEIIKQVLCTSIKVTSEGVIIDYWNVKTQKSTRIKAKYAVLAVPRFIAERIYKEKNIDDSEYSLSYAPWAVINVTLDKIPVGNGSVLAWDNVVYQSRYLGYVVATHQEPRMKPIKTVLTYYYPMSEKDPKEARQDAYQRSYEDWRDLVLDELYLIHPELKGFVKSVDVWVWGHAMIRPTTGFIWGDFRKKMLHQEAPVFSAHSDMSGISIFEEAYTHGVRAAENILKQFKISYRSEL